MSTDKRRALGKGLSALLPQRHAEGGAAGVAVAAAPDGSESTLTLPPAQGEYGHPLLVAVDDINPNPLQPRVTFNETALAELAASIRENGIIQPLIVQTSFNEGKYDLVAGERRLRAAKLAGLTEVPVIVTEKRTDKLLLHALIENIQREDLNPIETAEAMQKLRFQLNLSHEEIADRTGKDRSTVTNLLRILKLPPEVQLLIAERRLSMGHAKALLGVEDPQVLRDLANRAAAQGFSVRQLERTVAKLTEETVEKEAATEPVQDPNIRAAARNLEGILGTRVRIVEQGNERGRIEIEFYSQDDLQRIYAMLTRES